jgi:hypothetical protein
LSKLLFHRYLHLQNQHNQPINYSTKSTFLTYLAAHL